MTAPRFYLARLSVLSYANGFTLWAYVARQERTVGPFHGIPGSVTDHQPPQTLEECLTPGFFNPAAMDGVVSLQPGDMIALTAVDGAAWLWVERTTPDVRCHVMGWTGSITGGRG